jgi:serine protease
MIMVEVRSSVTIYDAGYHYILLIRIRDDNTGYTVDQYEARPSDGYYPYAFHNVQPGRYLVIAGSDRNNNYYLGDGGESLGAWPTVDQMAAIEVSDRNIGNLDFTTNFRLSIRDADNMNFTTGFRVPVSNSGMSAADEPAAVRTVFRRLR